MTEAADRNRLFIPSLAPFYAGIEPYLYPFMRVVVGLMMVPHGIEKPADHVGGNSVYASDQRSKGYRHTLL
jgi:hypothetical protein